MLAIPQPQFSMIYRRRAGMSEVTRRMHLSYLLQTIAQVHCERGNQRSISQLTVPLFTLVLPNSLVALFIFFEIDAHDNCLNFPRYQCNATLQISALYQRTSLFRTVFSHASSQSSSTRRIAK